MKKIKSWEDKLTDVAVDFTQPDIMMKLISTVDDKGWPHLTILTSNRAKSNNQIVLGEFCRGLSKEYIVKNKKVGAIFMSAEMPYRYLQVKAEFDHIETEGEDLEIFNKSQLMRYMTYMSVYKAYYCNVIKASPIKNLPLGGVVIGVLKALIGKGGAKRGLNERRLTVDGYKLFKGPINPKFLAYMDPEDSFPVIIPLIQLQAADYNRLIFPTSGLKQEIERIPINKPVAVIAMNLDLANQLAKGIFKGFKRFRGIKLGIIDIEEVYNSSPPIPGSIYPKLYERPKVEKFDYKI